MIRFRLGQAWKREDPGPGGPRDAFALELDGVNLLPGANDEPLLGVVAALVEALASMIADGERAGQVSLEDVHLELCLWRTEGQGVQLSVIDLSQPPRCVQGPVQLELPEVLEAAARCARTLLGDLGQRPVAPDPDVQRLERQLRRLLGAVVDDLPAAPAGPWSAVRDAGPGLGFVLTDDDGRTLAWSRKTRAGLPPLLFGGELTLPSGRAQAGHPVLAMLGLARAATGGGAALGGEAVAPAEVFRAGLDLCLALRQRNPALATNPYLETLQLRCTDGLVALRQPVPDTTAGRVVAPRATPGVALAPVGELRRVRLQPGWSRPVALGEEGGRLLLGKKWVLAHSPRAAHAFTRAGREGFRRLANRGVAIAESGLAVLATNERVLALQPGLESARWLRDHDGVAIGPTLREQGGVLVTMQGRRGAVGFDALTGRERWRFEPARTQWAHLSVLGPRVLLGTDDGSLYGLDVDDGQLRFRVKASLPVLHPALPIRRRALAVLGRGEHAALFLCDALAGGGQAPAGGLVWTRELLLGAPCPPVAARGRVFIGGSRDGRTLLVALGPRGQVLWEKPVPLDARTLRLVPWEGGVLATDARGAAARLLPDGSPAWVLGACDDELHHAIAPAVARQVLVVPGPVTRLVQPSGGRVLAELETSGHLLDVAVDARLNLYVLREPGTLEHWAPAATLAVLSGPSTTP